MNIKFVTGNISKFNEVSSIFEGSDINLEQYNIDLTEIQGSPKEIVLKKAELAHTMVDPPFFVEDISLCYESLNYMPGPYIKWFLGSLGHEGLYKLVKNEDNKRAFAVCTVCYVDTKGEYHIYSGSVSGEIVAPRGSSCFGWDCLFVPDGCSKTFGEMDQLEKNRVSHRGIAYGSLMEKNKLFSK